MALDWNWFMVFIVPPTLLVALGYAAVLWHEHELRKSEQKAKKRP